MLATQRHNAIVALLHSRGGARHHELVRTLGVSAATVRRDLITLDARGVLHRVHGGAVPVATPFVAWRPAPPDPGPAIAAASVPPGTPIAVSGGAHTVLLAKALAAVPDLTVVTTSVPVAIALHGASHREHIVVGGISTPGGQVGALALAAIRSLHVDTLFLAVHGVTPGGFTAADRAEAEIGQALIDAARQVVVLADHTTRGRPGTFIARLDQATVVLSGA